MISSFAAAVHAPWMVAATTFADAEIVRIGKNCLTAISLSDQIGKNLFGKFTTGIFFNGA